MNSGGALWQKWARRSRAWFSWRTWRPRSPCPLESLHPAGLALEAFSKRTDEDFTDLARGVSDILGRMRKVSAQTERLGAVLQDRDEARALHRAYQVYKQSVDLVHASMGVALADHGQLEKVEHRLLEACANRGALEQHSLVFRMVTVETRIEAMRLDHEGQQVFLTVGDAIQHMGRRINETANTAFGRIEEVVAETREERENLQRHQLNLHEEAQHSVARIRTELDNLHRALSPCGAEVGEVLTRVGEMHRIADQVVMALQSQDIMRQQLEHVHAGFEEMKGHKEDEALLLQATQVQRLQLGSAKERIEQATATLQVALQNLADRGKDLAERFVTLETSIAAALGSCRLAVLFKEETEKLAQIANQSEQSNQRIAELVSRVDAVIKAFSAEVSSQQFDVTLVALNAQIAAARLPGAGALNRLAEETSSVAAQVGQVTETITRQFSGALDALRLMKQDADNFQVVIVRDKGQLEQESAQVNALLVGLQEGLHRDSVEANREFAQVQESLRNYTRQLQWQEEIDEVFGAAKTACEVVWQWGGKGTEEALQEPHYRAEKAGYTMAAEYALHAEALGGVAKGKPTAPPAEPSKDIELF